ncbi:NAD(P)/FAD-dependent oxidoreductase [Rhizobium sp. 'Codium 1']|uniref:NAD(P)/FAD-dependent oxidoreductase n=1 Tax=Rhizobium sp. 'Codium 1' TaxID=2940484 RepID=UPI001E614FF3|nr:FAD-dependent oxidoreductase [Rhizobium sp. 'Codium 1']MCC8934493.1 FAD-binding oxidoreductase [Rhizobium sp. 'Codium 1']
MPLQKRRIVIIGAGIFGTAMAYHMASPQTNIVLIESGSAPACGVTGRAFGWINTVHGRPGSESHALWQKAVRDYPALIQDLPEIRSFSRGGSLLWHASTQETEHLLTTRRDAGETVELVDRAAISRLEPHLRHIPETAVFSADDIAIDPIRLATTLLSTARRRGATVRFDETVSSIETANGHVTGVQTSTGLIETDCVVLAAGRGTDVLAKQLGIDLGMILSPALLLRYACQQPFIRHILDGPRVEVRQSLDNTVFIAESWHADMEEPPSLIGARFLSVLVDEFDIPSPLSLIRAEIGHRPTFHDNLPRIGFVPEVEGLYLATGHPGLILAPYLARLATRDILHGDMPDVPNVTTNNDPLPHKI